MDPQIVQLIVSGISAIAIPVVLLYLGKVYERTEKDKELKRQYIELAVAVLKEQPTPDSHDLRTWAVRLIDKYSDVPFQHAGQALVSDWPLLRQAAMDRVADDISRASPADGARIRTFYTRRHLATFGLSPGDVKRRLADAGYFKGPLDDEYTPEFFGAVSRFQSEHGLRPVDGIFGPDSRRALDILLAAEPASGEGK